LIGLHEAGGEPIAPLVSLGRLAVALVEDAMAAYESSDAQQAQEAWARDKDLDKMYSTLFGKVLAFMTGDPRRTSTGTQMLMMARTLERAGDRARNIAEMVRYLTEGAIVEEKRPKANATKTL
jgi:phosphate transport system protein